MAASAYMCVFTIATLLLQEHAIITGGQILKTNVSPLALVEFSSSVLTSRTWNAAEVWPLCVLYRGSASGIKASKLDKYFVQFVQHLTEDSPFREWTFGSINTTNQTLPSTLHPGIVPCLLCHIGAFSPLEYKPKDGKHPSMKSIKRWLKTTVTKALRKRIIPIQSNELSSTVALHNGVTLVGVPGYLYHSILEVTLKEIASKWKSTVQVVIVLPSTKDERNITQTFGVREFPAVLLFEYQAWEELHKPVTVLQGLLNIGLVQIELELTIRQCQATRLTVETFEAETLETKHPQAPMAVTFYSPRNPRTLDYLYVLEQTINKFAKIDSSFRFGLVSLVENGQVVDRHVDASFVTAVPFTVVFWQENEPLGHKYLIKQQLFKKEMPTAQDFYDFVRARNIPLLTDIDSDEPWADEKDTCDLPLPPATQCLMDDNSTVAQWQESSSKTTFYGPNPAPPGWKMETYTSRSKRRKRVHKIPYVTDRTWAAVIEHSIPPQKSYSAEKAKHATSSFSVSLVVFIKERCGYCEKVMPTLDDIAKSVNYIGASMYLMNCTSDPVRCKQHGVTGFPTVTAFRSLSWSAAQRCFPPGDQSRYIRVDYHGPIVPNLVLQWLSNINRPAINNTFMREELPTDLDDDVRLVATLYTRSLARRYLPSMLYNRWYPYECYNLVCELLYGLVSCYALYTRDVVDYVSKSKTDETELILSKLVLQRADGVRSKVFELGYTLESTLNDKSNTRLHLFHEAHRYNITSNFKCEDDHATCTDIVVQFVSDHKRLPISHITAAAFHAKTGTQGEKNSNIFSHELPVMLVLAHGSNITRGSNFYKEVTKASYALYRDMMFVTLNVDEFSFWASNFVPKGYHAKYAYTSDPSIPPSLYHYPRLCIVRWEDHQHAAFYPPVTELERLGTRVQSRLDQINSQQVIKFAQDFLKNPKEMVKRTEMF